MESELISILSEKIMNTNPISLAIDDVHFQSKFEQLNAWKEFKNHGILK